MAFIDWNDSLSVKIDSIDDEHKKLINMINEFYENIETKSNDELISKLIKEMKEYTLVHFSTEEKYFEQFNYPGYESHKKEHDAFVKKVIYVEKRFLEGSLLLSLEITKFLMDWLKEHIRGTDQQYTEFLIMKGVK